MPNAMLILLSSFTKKMWYAHSRTEKRDRHRPAIFVRLVDWRLPLEQCRGRVSVSNAAIPKQDELESTVLLKLFRHLKIDMKIR